MGMEIEVVGKTWYTVHLTDDDVEKVKQYIKEHEEYFRHYFDMKEKISQAIWELQGNLNLFSNGKYEESDFCTEEINWSVYEERTPEEILGI